MTFDIEVAGRRRSIEVRRGSSGWTVLVDGRKLSASVTELDGRWSLLIGSSEYFEEGRASVHATKSYEIAVESNGGPDRVVHVNGAAVAVSIRDPRRRLPAPGRDPRSVGAGPQRVVAPMPGRIVKVLVKPGDAVVARQGLVVVEAMKMENELRATRAGTVAEVCVAEGMLVDAKALLVTLE